MILLTVQSFRDSRKICIIEKDTITEKTHIHGYMSWAEAAGIMNKIPGCFVEFKRTKFIKNHATRTKASLRKADKKS